MIRHELDLATASATRHRRKFLLRAGLACIVGFVGFLFLVGGAALLGRLTQSDDTAAVFNEAAELPPSLIDSSTWTPDRDDLARIVDPLTRDDLTRSWLRAWAAITVLAETGDRSALETYFSNDALRAVNAASTEPAQSPIRQISHDLSMEFFSVDGQVAEVGVTSQFLRGERFGSDVRWLATTETHRAVMLLEDGNWRIQHLVRTSVDGRWATGEVGPSVPVERILTATPVDMLREDHAPEALALVDESSAHLGDESLVLRPFGDRPPGLPSTWLADLEHLEQVAGQVASLPAEPIALELGLLSADPDGLHEAWAWMMASRWRELDTTTPLVMRWDAIDAGLHTHVRLDGQSTFDEGRVTIAPGAESLARISRGGPSAIMLIALVLFSIGFVLMIRRRVALPDLRRRRDET